MTIEYYIFFTIPYYMYEWSLNSTIEFSILLKTELIYGSLVTDINNHVTPDLGLYICNITYNILFNHLKHNTE